MSKTIIEDSVLSSLADKIREKLGVPDLMLPSTMPGKIGEISAGSGVYAWKKSDSSGNFVDYVVSDDENEYPEYGTGSDGFSYKLVGLVLTGAVWTLGSDQIFYNVQYANGIFVGVGNGGIYYSEDGVVWNKSNISDKAANYDTLHYANGIWVCGCQYHTYYSTDGKTWTEANLEWITTSALAYGNGVWVGFGQDMDWAGWVYTSTNGKTWNKKSCNFACNYVEYNNGVFVAATNSGIYYSTNGTTWTQVSNVISGNYKVLCYGDGLWLASKNRQYTYYSNDGKTWTICMDASIYNKDVWGIGYGNGLWVASIGGRLHYSTDAKVWTLSDTEYSYAHSIHYYDGLWVACGEYNGKKGLRYSTDGKTWTKSNVTSGYCYSKYAICNSDNIWVAATTEGCYYSKIE